MNFYDKILKFFGLKKRSAPNSKNWFEYFAFSLYPGSYLHIDGDIFLLGAVFLSYSYPKAYYLIIPIVFCLIYSNSEDEVESNKLLDARELVNLIQYDHYQSLKEKLEFDPALLHATYKEKSLLYWCKYYQNYTAHRLIIKMMKEQNIEHDEVA